MAEQHFEDHDLAGVEGLQQLADFSEQVLERKEQIRKIRVASIDVERSFGTDEETVDDGKSRDREHEAGVALVHHVLSHHLLTHGANQSVGK